MLQLRNLLRRVIVTQHFNPTVQPTRNTVGSGSTKSRNLRPYLRDLWGRRQILGPEPVKPRSAKFDWNYDAEIFAFGKRLGEQFQTDTLRRTFIHRAYAEQDVETRSKFSQQPFTSGKMNDNSEFIENGEQIISNYVKAFLRYHFPKLPEEGIIVIKNHLTTDENLAVLSKHIGTYDLILTTEFPIAEKTLRDSFAAVVGALFRDTDLLRAELFVRDFVLTQLVSLDVNEIFYVANPMDLLTQILASRNKGVPEPRIIRQAGSFTIMPVYVVGIYSDKEILGYSPGETIQIAVDIAARESLKTLWGTKKETMAPYKFNEFVDLKHYKEIENEKLRDIISHLNDASIILTNPVEQEPLDVERMAVFYKDKIEKSLGTPLVRRLKHRFHYGTPMRKAFRKWIRPKPSTI